jgi:hypothetical protein
VETEDREGRRRKKQISMIELVARVRICLRETKDSKPRVRLRASVVNNFAMAYPDALAADPNDLPLSRITGALDGGALPL